MKLLLNKSGRKEKEIPNGPNSSKGLYRSVAPVLLILTPQIDKAFDHIFFGTEVQGDTGTGSVF